MRAYRCGVTEGLENKLCGGCTWALTFDVAQLFKLSILYPMARLGVASQPPSLLCGLCCL